MRPFRNHARRWPVSALCIVSLCAALCSGLFFSTPLRAQVGITQVAVVDFRNSSKMPGQMFGRMATDAVVLELIRSGKFGVVPSDSLSAMMNQLGYDANMSQSAMIRLGQEVEASAVLSGDVLSINFDKDKKKAEARIAVKLLDVASGEMLNGAVATGISQPRTGYTADEDRMLVEAIKDAARTAVETMVAYTIPEATVLNSVGTSEVLLNKGSREGLQPGMEMIVIRRMDGGEEVVGRVRVNKVSDSDAMATILKAPRGVKPEDRVRAVYKMPDISDTSRTVAPRSSSRPSITSGNKLLMGLALIIGIGALFGNLGDKPESVSGVAAAGATPDITSAFDDGGVFIGWNEPRGVRTSDIIEYHVWRDNHGNYFASGGEATLAGPVLVPDSVTATPYNGGIGRFDHHSIDDTAVRLDYTWNYVGIDGELAQGTQANMPGITVGKTHKYWLSCVYRITSPTDGSVGYKESTPTYLGTATYVLPPVCVSPDATTGLPLSSITFEWELSAGANRYRVEVSTSDDFIRDQTVCFDVNRSTDRLTVDLRSHPELAGVFDGQELFWRVGAKNSNDRPGPMPSGNGASAAATGTKNTRYIYSTEALSFFVDAPPGTGPGDDDGGGDDGGGPPPPPDI
ncbi:MAG: hypothetical protein KBC96_12755 [Armatimonadetes bacterium]|nr:hypothetical protein [Armatimonadota bacterium]